MGLRVVFCERVLSVVGVVGGAATPGRVLVVPASDLMFTRWAGEFWRCGFWWWEF